MKKITVNYRPFPSDLHKEHYLIFKLPGCISW